MQAQGYEVVEYANESESAATEKVPMITRAEIKKHTLRTSEADFYAKDAVIGSPLWRLFDRKLRRELTRRFDPDHDIVCHPFGRAHAELATALGGFHIETGIGYNDTFARFRVYESYAWMHYHQGKERRGGDAYEWVVPNYFDLDEWPLGTPRPIDFGDDYLLFFGRIVADKGMAVVKAIAERVNIPVVVCGQGDPEPWKHTNIFPVPPVSGRQRASLLGGARAVLMPTQFTEPFGGSGVEGQLLGTPLLSTDHGAFAETVIHGFNGYRCHTLGDWLTAIDNAKKLSRYAISRHARANYSLEAVGKRYDAVFQQVNDLRGDGWFTREARNVAPA